MLLVGSTDPKFSETETRKLLEAIGGAHIEVIEDMMRYLLYFILVIVAMRGGGVCHCRHPRPSLAHAAARSVSRHGPAGEAASGKTF